MKPIKEIIKELEQNKNDPAIRDSIIDSNNNGDLIRYEVLSLASYCIDNKLEVNEKNILTAFDTLVYDDFTKKDLDEIRGEMEILLKGVFMTNKEKLSNRYLDSIDFQAVETTNELLKELEKMDGFELIVAKKFNAYLRGESKKVNDCIGSWFGYTLNGYYVYFQFDYFWLFEGISVSAYPLDENGTYKNNKYSLKFKEPLENFNELLDLLKNPKEINDRQKPIYARSKSDREHVSRSRKIEPKIYY